MAELNPNSNPLLLWNKIKELKYKLKQFETLLGICPFNLEDIKGDVGPQGPPGPPGSSSITKTSELINDGEDGINFFIAEKDIFNKAEKNASNLSESNITDWLNTLDVYSKSKINLELSLKLDKPTIDGTYIIEKIGDIVSYKAFSDANYYTKEYINIVLATKQDVLGYTPENVANKQNTLSPDGTGEKYTTVDAVNSGLNNKLDKGGYTGNAQVLKDEIEGKASISHTHNISDVTNLQTALDNINNDINNLEGINYIWSPTNRTLTLFDREGNQLSQVSLVSLDNEGTDLRYNATTLSLDLYNADNELLDSIPVSSFVGSVGTQLHLNSNQLQLKDNQGNVLSTVNFQIDDKTTENVVATTAVGAINAGETVPAGTNIQELTELLLNKTFYPTFVNHTFGLTNNAGLREVGSSFNVTLTFNFNRGQILGKLDNGIWNPTMLQDYRAGAATSYLLNGVSGTNNSRSFDVTTNLGTNALNGYVTYGIGVQPKDSKNNDFESPFPAGTSPIQSTSFDGIYPYFYYKSTSPITPEIMQSAIANGQATKVLASSTGTITIPFAANGEYIAVAYPATSATKTIWYVNALDNGEIPGGLLGGVNTLPCNSPTNLWNNVNFKIHVSAGLITQPNPIQLKNS